MIFDELKIGQYFLILIVELFEYLARAFKAWPRILQAKLDFYSQIFLQVSSLYVQDFNFEVHEILLEKIIANLSLHYNNIYFIIFIT